MRVRRHCVHVDMDRSGGQPTQGKKGRAAEMATSRQTRPDAKKVASKAVQFGNLF